jgi:hypothetical protein
MYNIRVEICRERDQMIILKNRNQLRGNCSAKWI